MFTASFVRRTALTIITAMAMLHAGAAAWFALGADRIPAGSSISVDEHIVSSSGQFTFGLQPSGRAAISFANQPRMLWATSQTGDAATLFMQADGNAVIYDRTRRVLWNSRTDGHPGAYMVLQNDGNLVIKSATGWPLWSSATSTNELRSGETLHAGWMLTSRQSLFALKMQSDGTLTITNTHTGATTWNSYAAAGRRVAGSYAVMQSDGNLVIYSPTRSVIWSTASYGNAGGYAAIAADGGLKVLRAGDVVASVGIPLRRIAASQRSTNWSGMVSQPSPGRRMTYVAGDWTVPTAHCTASSLSRANTVWIGLDGWGSGSVEQIGMSMTCPAEGSGPMGFDTWWETYPEPPVTIRNMRTTAGDHMHASVMALGNNTFRLSLDNLTRDTHYSVTHTLKNSTAQLASAEWICESLPGRYNPPFGHVALFNVRAQQSGEAAKPFSSFADTTRFMMQRGTSSPLRAYPGDLLSPSAFWLNYAAM